MTPAGANLHRARLPATLAVPAGRALLERWLAGIEPQHHGLPAGAIVVVRRLQGSVAALSGPRGPHGLRAPDPLVPALRAALRPAQECFVGAGVAAVWFADEAELLASLARDALRGSPSQRWWWPLVLGTAPSLPAMQARWCASARVVPQALAQLAPQGDDSAWLHRLQAPGRAALLSALAQHHPLGAAAVRCVQDSERRRPSASAHRQQPSPQPAPSAGQADIPPAADPVRVLLRLAAVLRNAPQRALADAVAALLLGDAPVAEGPPSAPPPTRTRRGRSAALASKPTAAPSAERARAGAPAPTAGPTPAAAAPDPAAPGRPDAAAAGCWRSAVGVGSLPSVRPQPARAPQSGLVPARPNLHIPPSAAPARTSGTAPGATAAGPTTSEFGGLCFLLNVALAAGLYGDFTQPRHAGLPVSPWRFLHAAGAAYFGRAFKADPLARLLAAKAGTRPLTQPPAPGPWQLDAVCLHPHAGDPRPWHVLHAPRRLRIVHPAGFVLAQGASAIDLQAVLDRAPDLVWHTVSDRSARGPGLLDLLWPWLARRLALALDLPAARPALALALRLPARLQWRGEQLHLHFSLSALPLAVRLAGLDRDPGWIPAAGCDFRFHFD